MREMIRAMSATTKTWLFGIVFVVVAFLALSPPIYLTFNGAKPDVLGMPLSVFYMIGTGFLITVAVVALFLVEKARGELD
jgi:hypothetical protein